jgi:hypothetical protein
MCSHVLVNSGWDDRRRSTGDAVTRLVQYWRVYCSKDLQECIVSTMTKGHMQVGIVVDKKRQCKCRVSFAKLREENTATTERDVGERCTHLWCDGLLWWTACVSNHTCMCVCLTVERYLSKLYVNVQTNGPKPKPVNVSTFDSPAHTVTSRIARFFSFDCFLFS